MALLFNVKKGVSELSAWSILNNFKITNKRFVKDFENYPKQIERKKSYEINGKDVHVYDEWFENSKHKYILLNNAYLEALTIIYNEKVTYALQRNDGETSYLLSEFLDEGKNKIVATAYAPDSGRFYSCNRSPKGKNVAGARLINGEESDGVEVWLSLLLAISQKDNIGGDFLNDLGSTGEKMYKLLEDVLQKKSAVPDSVYALQQYMWNCIEDARLPLLFNTTQSKGNDITINQLDEGMYLPTTIVINGDFKIFKEDTNKKKADNKLVKELIGDISYITIEDEEEKSLIPDNGDLLVTKELTELIDAITKGHQRVFILRGDAGTGKSTVVQNLATALQMPYRFLNCSYDTDEAKLLSNMIPNMDSDKEYLTEEEARNICLGLQFDIAGTVEAVTGEAVDEDISEGVALKKIVDALCNKKVANEKDFKLVRSQLVDGAVKPSVVEILEPTLIGNAGVLPSVNSLFDDTQKTTLVDGTTIDLNPNSIFVFTTNMDYKGCKDLNESIMSRAKKIIDFDNLSEEEMVNRVLSRETTKTLIKENNVNLIEARRMAMLMAQTITLLTAYMTEYITGGVCGYREYENWFHTYLYTKNPREAAKSTVISHISFDKETKDDLYNQICRKIPDCK